MSAQDWLHPHQFEDVYSEPMDMSLPEMSRHHYATQPRYMSALEKDIKRQGIKYSSEVVRRPGEPVTLTEGNHRASVAYKLGIPLPVEDLKAGPPIGDPDHTEMWHQKYWKLEEEPRLRYVEG